MSGAAFALTGAAAAALCAVPGDAPVLWALRLAAAAVLTCVVPGALTVIAWRPRASFTLFELLGISLGVSVALVQLLTIAAVMYSWSVDVSLVLLAAWTVAHAAAAVRGRAAAMVVTIPRAEIAIGALLALAGAALYVAGSPFDTTEPRVHISLVRRLVHLSSPTPYTLYLAPEVVYTYPFPGTHYLLALMSRAGGIDPFFLYVKTRAVWGVFAALLVYGCAQAVFRSRRISIAATAVALGLVANGAFAAVPNFSWAQLAPFSHASDVAMGVLLPALLLLSFHAIDPSGARERRFFFAATLGMALTLVMVHPREIVQFLVYLTAFAAAAAVIAPLRPLSRRAALLVIATLAILIVYRAWHQGVVTGVDDIVEREKDGLARLFRDASAGDLLAPPLPLLRSYMIAFEPMFHGWNPVVLLASPLALFALRKRPLALFLGASIVCYLLIIRLPLLGIPYAYLTYFEILYTPVRNVIFFIHVLAGVCVYLAAARIARYSTPVAVAGGMALGAAAALAIRTAGPALADRPEHPDWLFVPVLAAYAALAWLAWRRRSKPVDDGWIETPPSRWPLVMAAVCAPLLIATEMPGSSVRSLSSEPSPGTPAALLSSLPCLGGDRQFCAPPRALIRLAGGLPISSVLAVDMEDEYQPSLFIPQQMVAWPGTAEGLLPRAVFARYFERYDKAQEAFDDQPFFNEREARADRLAFIRELGVTHVLVNPRMYAVMTRVLAQDPDVFTPRYNDGRWALYEVAPAFRALKL